MCPKKLFKPVILLWLLLGMGWAPTAMAFVDPPTLNPQNAAVGQLVHVQIRSGFCDGFVSDPNDEYPQLTISGNQVHIVFFSVHYEQGAECIFEPGTFSYPVGEFDAGDYVVTVDRIYPDIGGLTTETLGQLPLIVGGGSPVAQQLPVNLPLALLAMFFALGMIAFKAIHRSGKAGNH